VLRGSYSANSVAFSLRGLRIAKETGREKGIDAAGMRRLAMRPELWLDCNKRHDFE
jgi:hypothetical protein